MLGARKLVNFQVFRGFKGKDNSKRLRFLFLFVNINRLDQFK